jgi:hypothetical protein
MLSEVGLKDSVTRDASRGHDIALGGSSGFLVILSLEQIGTAELERFPLPSVGFSGDELILKPWSNISSEYVPDCTDSFDLESGCRTLETF